jgi:hypothetical protein
MLAFFLCSTVLVSMSVFGKMRTLDMSRIYEALRRSTTQYLR